MSRKLIEPSKPLRRLIEANAPYWGAEAEIIRCYWSSPQRSRDTDRKWLQHQLYKEYWDGIRPYLDRLNQSFSQIAELEQRSRLRDMAEVVRDEVGHFLMFVDLYEQLEGQPYQLDPQTLRELGAWSENDALLAARARHREVAPAIGLRAASFSEGGYVALFSEGMKLAGGNAFDSAIARVCRVIHDEEFHHMLLGIIETDAEQLSEPDWQQLESFTVEQMKCRVAMRQAQFSDPVPAGRLAELLAGAGDPVVFDFDLAGRLMGERGS